jgi:hypothetical protein
LEAETGFVYLIVAITQTPKAMKLKIRSACFFILASVILAGCVAPKSISTITGCDYDKVKDRTDYFILPFGSVSMPGKWDKTNAAGAQQFFVNKDSVEIAIGFTAYNSYEFNRNGALKGFNFVKAFYEWDSKYFVDKYGLSRSMLEKDSLNNYVLYRLFGKKEKTEIDTYFLIGEKNGNISNFSITITDKWTEQNKIDFLKGLFLAKKEE